MAAQNPLAQVEEDIQEAKQEIKDLKNTLKKLEEGRSEDEYASNPGYTRAQDSLARKEQMLVELLRKENLLRSQAAAQQQAAHQQAQQQVAPAELVEVMRAGFSNVVATLKAPKASRAALPSGLSSISQSGFKYLQEDFGIEVVAVPAAQLPAVENAPAIPAYQWLPRREDDQKTEYMAHINAIIPLEDHTEWVQGDQYGALLTADQVHTWPEGESEPYHLSGTPDAVVILTVYKDIGLPWEGIRLTVEVKKTMEMRWHYEAAAQLILSNIWSSKFKPMALLTDLVDEWHLKYMSGKKLCAGRFPSRAAAVACIKAWLQKEKIVETGAETEDPLAISGPADEEGLGPVLKRVRYMHSVPGVAPREACLTDLADCLPREEAREVLCLAGLQDLMQHYRPLTSAARHSMFS